MTRRELAIIDRAIGELWEAHEYLMLAFDSSGEDNGELKQARRISRAAEALRKIWNHYTEKLNDPEKYRTIKARHKNPHGSCPGCINCGRGMSDR